MKVLFLGADFMLPYWQPEIPWPVAINLHEPLVPQIAPHTDAAFAYAMNTPGGENTHLIHEARDLCKQAGIRTVWASVEDPNSFGTFFQQAAGFDLICTSDAVTIPRYLDWYPEAHVIWLPMACQPAIHRPRPTAPDATDLVLIANWYTNDARLAAVRTLLDPLLAADLSLSLYAYAQPAWPEKYRRWWRGATSCYDVAVHYPNGRVALGMNNQAWETAMCSMRTFEVLACGKPFLSYHSDAYERLGFVCGEHFFWTDNPDVAVSTARLLLVEPEAAAAVAARGRAFVLEHHTYQHRLQSILEALG